MAMRELVFDIFAIDRASATLSRIGGEAEVMGSKFGKVGAAIGTGLAVAGVAVAAVGVEAVKTSADMETAMTRLTTTAGESTKNIQMVWSGIDKMAGQVGYSVKELASAMYYVESGGYHGAKGLEVLRAAAQGAKIENADVTEVAHALAGAMNDYRAQNISAATAMNVMTAAVGHGMMTFQDMAEALPKIGSRAAAAHVQFQELMAAMATMTQDGLPASVAATYLGQTIGQLAAPTNKAYTEMKKLGINATDVAAAITSGSGHGLGDAIKMLYDGITRHLTPAGLVAVETFKKSKATMSDFQKMVANVPPDLQTVVQALALSSGGVKAFQGVLMLGGANTKAYNSNLAAMNDQLRKGHGAVAGVAEQQATLNGKLADARGAVSGLLDELGQRLLPVATRLLDWFNRSLPAMEAWVAVVAKNATPMLKALGGYLKNELWPALQSAYQTILPALKQAWDTVTGGLKGNGSMLHDLGDLLAKVIIPVVAEFIRVYLPYWAFQLRMLMEAVKAGYQAFEIFKTVAIIMAVEVLRAFARVLAGWGSLLIALGHVPGFDWATVAGRAMLGAAGAAGSLAKALSEVKSPPPINIKVNAYGTSAIANAIISGNAPLANSMMAANSYASGGAYTTTSAGSQRINGGMRASGGFVQAGRAYVVGENHPEVFIPQTNGYISPHRPSAQVGSNQGSGGVNVNIEHFHADGQSPTAVGKALMWELRTA